MFDDEDIWRARRASAEMAPEMGNVDGIDFEFFLTELTK